MILIKMAKNMESPEISFEIRAAALEDVFLLGKIEQAAAGIFESDVLPSELKAYTLPLSMLDEGVKNGSLWVACTCVNGVEEIVGYALARIVEGSGHLAQIDVLPAFMRKGIGSALLMTTAVWGKDTGLKELWLTTFEHIAWNAPFYSKFGFEKRNPKTQPAWVKHILMQERQINLKGRIAMCLNPAEANFHESQYAKQLTKNCHN